MKIVTPEAKLKKAAYDKVYAAIHKTELAIHHRDYYLAHQEERRAYRVSHAEHYKALRIAYRERKREWGLMRRYGLSQEELSALLTKQGGICAICESSSWGQLGPVVDHDHVSGKIRGILCVKCNLILGKLKDSPEFARKFITYLEK